MKALVLLLPGRAAQVKTAVTGLGQDPPTSECPQTLQGKARTAAPLGAKAGTVRIPLDLGAVPTATQLQVNRRPGEGWALLASLCPHPHPIRLALQREPQLSA